MYCVSLFGRAGSGTLGSAALTLMRMDALEIRILYEEVIRDILFYFFFSFLFHFVPIFVAKRSLLWSFCTVFFFPGDHLSVKQFEQHFFLFSADEVCNSAGGASLCPSQTRCLSLLMTTHFFLCLFQTYNIKASLFVQI